MNVSLIAMVAQLLLLFTIFSLALTVLIDPREIEPLIKRFHRVPVPTQVLQTPKTNLHGLQRLAVIGALLLIIRVVVQFFAPESRPYKQAFNSNIKLANDVQTQFKSVSSSLGAAAQQTWANGKIAQTFNRIGIQFTEQDQYTFSWNSYTKLKPFTPEIFEQYRARFEPHQYKLIEIANQEETSDEVRSIILQILVRATLFNSPESEQVLFNRILNGGPYQIYEGLALLAYLPKRPVPMEIREYLEHLLLFIGKNRSVPLERLYVLKAMKHCEPNNLPFLESLGQQLASRTEDDLYDENGGWTKGRIVKPGYNCHLYKDEALRDSYTYELAKQLAEHTGNVNELLLRWAQSSDSTLHHLVFESLRGRDSLSENEAGIIRALRRSLDESASSQLLILILQSKRPTERDEAIKGVARLLASDKARDCVRTGLFNSLLKEAGLSNGN